MAGSRDQDVGRRACAVQTTAPVEKGTTRWLLSSIHRHRPPVASTLQQGGSGEQSKTSKPNSVFQAAKVRNQTSNTVLPPLAQALDSAQILAPVSEQHMRNSAEEAQCDNFCRFQTSFLKAPRQDLQKHTVLV